MTHGDLVARAERWLRNSLHCGVVLTELVTAGEVPDAIGWVNGRSILVECKTSRADFRADRKKPERSPLSTFALGDWRFYLAPEGIIPHDEILEGWGLYEVRGRSVVHAAGRCYENRWRVPIPGGPSVLDDAPFESSRVRERRLLLSALRRAQTEMSRRQNEWNGPGEE